MRDRALEAIGLYRTSPDAENVTDFRQDVNDAVDSFQNAVSGQCIGPDSVGSFMFVC